MAASSSSSSSPLQDNQRTGDDDTGHPRDAKHRRHHIDNLQVQVPVPHPTASCFTGCFRPSPTASSSANTHHHHHLHGGHAADRPASPSLIRSPTAWIRSFGSSGNKHARRRSRDFQYDATSYARNFDKGGTDGEGEDDRLFTSRLPTSPPATSSPSPSGLGTGGGAGNVKSTEEAARQTGT